MRPQTTLPILSVTAGLSLFVGTATAHNNDVQISWMP